MYAQPSPVITLSPGDVELADTTPDDSDITLPPLPAPNARQRNRELRCGSHVVIGIVALALAVLHGVLLAPFSKLSPVVRLVFQILVYTEAAIALISLERMAHGDPGCIKRTPETTRPLPEVVTLRLRAGHGLDGLQNVTDPVRGTFCVRCCVWRPPYRRGRKSHHCSVCQRCVDDFDHHCGFYGRCIAGRGLRGNMKYFVAMFLTGYAALLTIMVGMVLSFV